MSEPEHDFSVIDSTEESFLAFGFYFLNPIGFFIGCVLLSVLVKNYRKNNIQPKYAVYCTIASIALQNIVYFNDIFLSNDLIFKWNYTNAQMHWASITDIISTISYGLAKMLFYFAFTFHVISMFIDHSDGKIVYFLKIWMAIMGVACFIVILVVAADDASSNSAKETAITSPHNIYVTMLESHEGAKFAKYSMAAMILLDIIYFIVLIFVYIKKLRFLQNKHGLKDRRYLEAATKGVTLVIFSCLTFWVFFICIVADTPLKWWGSFDITSDAFCLFLMFECNEDLYNYLCGCCHRCYGNKLHRNQQMAQLVETTEPK